MMGNSQILILQSAHAKSTKLITLLCLWLILVAHDCFLPDTCDYLSA